MVGCSVLEFSGEIWTGGRHVGVMGGSKSTGVNETAQGKERELGRDSVTFKKGTAKKGRKAYEVT